MRKIWFLIFAFAVSGAWAQTVQVITYEQLEKKWKNTSDTVYLFNFWATWCKPCVEELPAFLKLDQELKQQPFKLILVSLDFPQHIDTRVIPFIKKNQIQCEVVILDDDANQWINKVNPQWDGSIPVTLLIKNNKLEFYDRTFDYQSLLEIVTPKLK